MLVKPQSASLAKIKVVGVGGAGGNALNNMVQNYDIEGVEFIAVNTDAQALANNSAETKLKIGEEITRGLGSGGNPQIGRKAAEESVDILHEHLAGADMVFITAGMGGGTGTGASPVIAGIAKNLGALTVAIVEKPFHFEGIRRMDVALQGIAEIKDKVDTLIVVPNQRLMDVIERNISFLEAMKKVDDVLAQAVKSISQLITQAGLINVDFADVRSIMNNAGSALMGMGTANGDNRATEAAKLAMSSPLLELSIDGATGVLFNVIGGKDLAMYEVDEAAKLIASSVHPEANIIFGATIDPELAEDAMQITILATGFDLIHKQTGVTAVSLTPGHQPTSHVLHTNPNIQNSQAPVSQPIQQNHVQTQIMDEDDNELMPTINPGERLPKKKQDDDDDLEFPTFLRRKKEY